MCEWVCDLSCCPLSYRARGQWASWCNSNKLQQFEPEMAKKQHPVLPIASVSPRAAAQRFPQQVLGLLFSAETAGTSKAFSASGTALRATLCAGSAWCSGGRCTLLEQLFARRAVLSGALAASWGILWGMRMYFKSSSGTTSFSVQLILETE